MSSEVDWMLTSAKMVFSVDDLYKKVSYAVMVKGTDFREIMKEGIADNFWLLRGVLSCGVVTKFKVGEIHYPNTVVKFAQLKYIEYQCEIK